MKLFSALAFCDWQFWVFKNQKWTSAHDEPANTVDNLKLTSLFHNIHSLTLDNVVIEQNELREQMREQNGFGIKIYEFNLHYFV